MIYFNQIGGVRIVLLWVHRSLQTFHKGNVSLEQESVIKIKHLQVQNTFWKVLN